MSPSDKANESPTGSVAASVASITTGGVLLGVLGKVLKNVLGSAPSDERCEPTRTVTGSESTSIDSQMKNSNSESADDRSVLVHAKATKGGQNKYMCAICLDVIVDSTSQKSGQDSIYCEGRCQTWIHRCCAGLSKLAFTNIYDSSNKQPFHCPNCCLDMQSVEINALHATVADLALAVADLKRNAEHAL